MEFRINPVIYSTPGQEKSGCDVRRRGYMCTFDPRYFNGFNMAKGTVPCPYIDKASTPYTYGFHKTLLSIIFFFLAVFFSYHHFHLTELLRRLDAIEDIHCHSDKFAMCYHPVIIHNNKVLFSADMTMPRSRDILFYQDCR